MMVALYHPIGRNLETIGAWLLGLLWMLPLLYAVWTAFHPAIYATHFDPLAPLTFANFDAAWQAAPFSRYLINTVLLVTLILVAQFVPVRWPRSLSLVSRSRAAICSSPLCCCN